MASFDVRFTQDGKFNATMSGGENIKMGFGQTQFIATGDYNDLNNKPKINGVEVIGEKEGIDYNLQDKMSEVTEQDIDKIIYG